MSDLHPVFPYSHQLVERIARYRPTAATFWGLHDHDESWEDLSPQGHARWCDFLREVKSEVSGLAAPQGDWDALAIDVLNTWLGYEQQFADSPLPFQQLRHIASPFQMMHLVLTQMAQDTERQREAVRARLAGLPEALARYREGLAHGLAIGEPVSVRQVMSCMAQGHNLVDRRLLDVIPGPESDAAHQAYAELTAWLASDYQPHARAEDGVGEERYALCVQGFLHDDLNLDETYAWGWQVVRELHTELQAVLQRVAPDQSLATAVESWRTAPQTTAVGPDAFLTLVRGWQQQALSQLEAVLPVPPVARALKIERAPVGLPPGAWYMAPSEDGSRPGTVQYSLREGPVALFDQQSTACHEGFPGHHLQLAIQTTLGAQLSRFHRLVFQCMGFAEGWALYAERLVDEHGGYDNDVQRAGYLVNQIARACRVVLDIGLHTARPIPMDVGLPLGDATGLEPGAMWTYERGVAFMVGIGGLRPEVAESEVTRYLGWPGQAISYTVGLKRILGLRERFLGHGGSLLAFHERVLGSGMVGLSRMEQTVLGTP